MTAISMNAQNIYDDPEFLAGYQTLDRQVRGLDGAAEWPTMRSMLPPLAGKRVIDLGCGFGWFSRWAQGEAASSVLGVDVSARMLERARADTASDVVEYHQADLDELMLAEQSADVAFSSLAFHYVNDFGRLASTVAGALTPGGSFVFSVEHPIYSAPSSQRFETSEGGDRVWPLDNYLIEGERITSWFVDGVIKQHRTVATYVNSVINAGFTLGRLVEWGPAAGDVRANPSLQDDLHRPWFLLVAATRDPSQ